VTYQIDSRINLRMSIDVDFKADLARYPQRPFLREQSIWAVYVYRFGRRVADRHPGIIRNIQFAIYWTMFRIVETITGISISLEAKIGPGLRIYHFGNVFIHSGAVIGRNCTLRQGVTIGTAVSGGRAPEIADDVEFGAYAQAFGDIHIASGAKIGAMSLVITDVPAKATAVGVPARIIAGRATSATRGCDPK
jgi:serine O-acetyltransferase